jgi:DNA repair exonuclease SbcCD nuclease subunit
MRDFKFTILADIHIDLFQNISMLKANMLTDRAEEVDNVWKQAIDETVDSGITQMFVLGDVFHRRNSRTDAINALVKRRLEYAKNKGLNVTVIVGNHDQANIAGETHALEIMKDVCEVVDTACIKTYSGIDFYCLPYEEYKGSIKSLEILLKQGKNTNRILLGHVGIMNASLSGFDHQSKEPVTLEELQTDKFMYSYFGHYHLPQDLSDNAMYVGSPCQHSLSDKEASRGYVEVEIRLDKNGWKAYNQRRELSSPKFLELDVSEYKPSNYQGKHYIKVTGCKRKHLEKLELDENVYATTGEKKLIVVDEDKVIKADLSWEQMVEKYVNITEKKKRSHKRLMKLGRELLNA